MHPALRSSVVAALLVALAGCARSEAPAPAEAPATAAPTAETEVVVFAASSLRDAFGALEPPFESAHPGAQVTFNFAGTQELRTQLEHGAPVDVFASADTRHMDELVQAGRVVDPVVFARNEPVVVVARERMGYLRQLADLPEARRIVLGAPEVPIGRYTLQILDRAATALGPDFRARVEANVVSRELNVRQVLAKVSLGEAEAGIVYRTDANAAEGELGVVTLPADVNMIAEYPIALVAGARHPVLARAWRDLVLSAEGQRTLREAGFLAPTESDPSP